MKKSELKEIIKTAFLAEADELNEKYDDVKEQEDVEVEDNVDVKDTENVDVDVEKDIDIDDVSKESDIEVKSEVPGESEDVAAILGLLTKAQEKAEGMGDEKLLDQIGNTITYYTRAHVVKSGDVMEAKEDDDVKEAMRGKIVDEKEDDVKEAMRGPVDIDEKEKEDVKEELTEEVKRFKKLAGLI
jgi:hypothetical protein